MLRGLGAAPGFVPVGGQYQATCAWLGFLHEPSPGCCALLSTKHTVRASLKRRTDFLLFLLKFLLQLFPRSCSEGQSSLPCFSPCPEGMLETPLFP